MISYNETVLSYEKYMECIHVCLFSLSTLYDVLADHNSCSWRMLSRTYQTSTCNWGWFVVILKHLWRRTAMWRNMRNTNNGISNIPPMFALHIFLHIAFRFHNFAIHIFKMTTNQPQYSFDFWYLRDIIRKTCAILPCEYGTMVDIHHSPKPTAQWRICILLCC